MRTLHDIVLLNILSITIHGAIQLLIYNRLHLCDICLFILVFNSLHHSWLANKDGPYVITCRDRWHYLKQM